MIRSALAALLLAITACASPAAQEPSKIPLRVLYAGVPEDARTAEFLDFLREHFTTVGSTPYTGFKPAQADDYDVVIFDAEAKLSANTIGLPTPPNLPLDYDRASVLVSGAGVAAAYSLQLKLDWL